MDGICIIVCLSESLQIACLLHYTVPASAYWDNPLPTPWVMGFFPWDRDVQ